MGALSLDIQGVLVEDGLPIPGALELVLRAGQMGVLIRLVTNTATKDQGAILAELRAMGFEHDAAELFTDPLAIRQDLIRHQLRP
jgi:ribonucleotide monophosphatase NagD (HAD superfamily)